jgi:hypothetical protein
LQKEKKAACLDQTSGLQHSSQTVISEDAPGLFSLSFQGKAKLRAAPVQNRTAEIQGFHKKKC